jgi:hypothetical protein
MTGAGKSAAGAVAPGGFSRNKTGAESAGVG